MSERIKRIEARLVDLENEADERRRRARAGEYEFTPEVAELTRLNVQELIVAEMLTDNVLVNDGIRSAAAHIVSRHAEVIRGLAMEASTARSKTIELERRYETLEVNFSLERRRRRELVAEQVELNKEVGIRERALQRACRTLYDYEVRLEKAEGHHPPDYDVESGIIPPMNRAELLINEAREEQAKVGKPLHRFSTFTAPFRGDTIDMGSDCRPITGPPFAATAPTPFPSAANDMADRISARQRAEVPDFIPSYEQLEEEIKRLKEELVKIGSIKMSHGNRPDWLAAENNRLAATCQRLEEERGDVERERDALMEGHLKEIEELRTACETMRKTGIEKRREMARLKGELAKAMEEREAYRDGCGEKNAQLSDLGNRLSDASKNVHTLNNRLFETRGLLGEAEADLLRLRPAPGEPGRHELKILVEGLERDREGLRFNLGVSSAAILSACERVAELTASTRRPSAQHSSRPRAPR